MMGWVGWRSRVGLLSVPDAMEAVFLITLCRSALGFVQSTSSLGFAECRGNLVSCLMPDKEGINHTTASLLKLLLGRT